MDMGWLRGVYPYLPWRHMRQGQFGGIKSLTLSFNTQKCEFCAQT